MKLYELPERSNVKIYVEFFKGGPEKVLIFDHLDGMYSYCYFTDDKTAVVHLSASTPLEIYKDGYRIEEPPMSADPEFRNMVKRAAKRSNEMQAETVRKFKRNEKE